eukprot:3708031-Pyramimonas_sp.AAC.2
MFLECSLHVPCMFLECSLNIPGWCLRTRPPPPPARCRRGCLAPRHRRPSRAPPPPCGAPTAAAEI